MPNAGSFTYWYLQVPNLILLAMMALLLVRLVLSLVLNGGGACHAAGRRDHAIRWWRPWRGDAADRAGGGRHRLCDHLADGGANGSLHGRPGHGRPAVRDGADDPQRQVSPLTLVVRGLLLIAAAALALFNGSLWSPFFDSVAYILYLTTRGFR